MWLAIPVAALLIACGGGPKATKADGSDPTTKATGVDALKPGESVNVSDGSGNKWKVTVNKISYQAKGCDSASTDQPDKGNAFVLVDVTYQSTAGKASYNPLDWSVVDKDGNESDYEIFSGCKPALDSGEAVGKRHGIVVFQVKAGTMHGQAVYSAGLGDSTSTWNW
jgi:hypothetical protein